MLVSAEFRTTAILSGSSALDEHGLLLFGARRDLVRECHASCSTQPSSLMAGWSGPSPYFVRYSSGTHSCMSRLTRAPNKLADDRDEHQEIRHRVDLHDVVPPRKNSIVSLKNAITKNVRYSARCCRTSPVGGRAGDDRW